MTSLAQVAGLEIAWNDAGTLTFAPGLAVEETLARPLERLRAVALEPEACVPPEQVQYWMYNGIARETERARLAALGLRYELTLMFPRAIGRERAKTLGHLHTAPPGARLNYPEICEVLHGTAQFIFQTLDIPARAAPFCYLIEAQPGDKVIIPPNLHHLTINAGDEPLLFSDVIPVGCGGIYQPFAQSRGAAYLNTLDAGLIPNPNYAGVGELIRLQPHSYPQFGLTAEIPLYRTFSESPDLLAWLNTPDRFPEIFPGIWAFIREAVERQP